MTTAAEAKKQAAKAEEVWAKHYNNGIKRKAVAFFNAPVEDWDFLDELVLTAWMMNQDRDIEDFDQMPPAELAKVIMGE